MPLTHRDSSEGDGREDGTEKGNWPEATLIFLPAACLGQQGVRAVGPVDQKSQTGDSSVTLGKVSALGSYYRAAAFFSGDWRG